MEVIGSQQQRVFVVVGSRWELLGAIGSHWESLGAVGVNFPTKVPGPREPCRIRAVHLDLVDLVRVHAKHQKHEAGYMETTCNDV